MNSRHPLSRWLARIGAAVITVAAIAAAPALSLRAAEPAVSIPAPAMTEPSTATSETVVLAGGCFWGVQGVFQHVKGVTSAVSGYAGGAMRSPTYEQVGSGDTGHAEAVKVTFDPKQVSYGDILRIYFSVAHDPTQLNRQGPDRGTQYRSAIFASTDSQVNVAKAYIAQLDKAKVYAKPIVTTVAKKTAFYVAEDYHQDYATLHPDNGYIAVNDLPKIANLKQMFPAQYRDKPVLVAAK